MSLTEDLEVGEGLCLYRLDVDELGMLLAVAVDPREKEKRGETGSHLLYVKTDEGLLKVRRVFVELESEDDEELYGQSEIEGDS